MSMNKRLAHYICVCLCQTKGDDPRPTDIEERFVLLVAESEQQALEKAAALKKVPYEFINIDGYAMSNRVLEIVDVAPVIDNTFQDGAELYSRYFDSGKLMQYRCFEPHLNKVEP